MCSTVLENFLRQHQQEEREQEARNQKEGLEDRSVFPDVPGSLR